MPALHIKTLPCDQGQTLSTAIVSGGTSEEILQVSAAESGVVSSILGIIRDGDSTAEIAAYIALVDKDLADAAIGIENMSAPQKSGLLAYIAAISAEEDTSSVETAISNL